MIDWPLERGFFVQNSELVFLWVIIRKTITLTGHGKYRLYSTYPAKAIKTWFGGKASLAVEILMAQVIQSLVNKRIIFDFW